MVTMFDPTTRLSRVKGQDYLEVRWRVAWLRAEHPTAAISTEMVSLADNRAIFRANVAIPDGGSASGFGSESASNFDNFIEKAETKAIGRALAALGYGTPYSTDFEDGVTVSYQEADTPPVSPTNEVQVMSPAQRGKLLYISRELGMGPEALNTIAQSQLGSMFDSLTRRQASALIDQLNARLPASKPAARAS